VAARAGVDDTGQKSKGTGALLAAGSLAGKPLDDRVPQGPFRFIMGQRQVGMDDNDPERFPVIEKFARQ